MGFSVHFNQTWTTIGPAEEGSSSNPAGAPSSAIIVQVYPQWFVQTSLDWVIPTEWGNCSFNVYVTFGTEDRWERLTPSPIKNPRFSNVATRETSRFRQESYIVEVITESGKIYRSFATSAKTEPRSKTAKIASEIQRREYLLLMKFSGIKSYLFNRRFYGERCTRCWSVTQEKTVDDHCPICLGTSFKGGYFDPLPSFIQYDPTPNDSNLGFNGRIETNQISAWTISAPSMNVGDIIVRSGDWNVYSIDKITTTELQTNTVRQILVLTQLGRNDIENSLLGRPVLDDFGTYLEGLGGDFSLERFPRVQIDGTPNDDPQWSPNPPDRSLPTKYRI